MKILIVEDHQGIRLALEMLLQLEGYDTLSVDRGEVALEVLENATADLVLLDLNTNGISAVEFSARLEALARAKGEPKPPVILVSGSSKLPLEAVQVGAHSFFHKPFEVDELVEHLRQFQPIQGLSRDIEGGQRSSKRESSASA